MAVRKSELVITCNAKGVQNIMTFLNEKLGGIKQRLQEINNEASKNGWTDQLEKEFKQLTQEATGIDNIINRNAETMKKYGEVMKDLSNSKLKDLKKALQEGRNALGKMTENDPKRQKLISELEKIGKEMKVVQGSAMSMNEATRNLKDLGNVSFDRLKQGLDAINERLNSTKLKAKDRTTLQGFQQQYQAEIAYRQSQTAVTNRNVGSLNAQQLRAEQAALNSAIGQMSGVKGYEKYLAQYETRLKAVNEQLTILSEKEKQAAADARNLTKTQQASDVVLAIYRKQAVSLEELDATYKTLEARANKFAGVNPAKAKAAQQQMAAVAAEIKRIKATMQEEIRIDKDFLRNATNQQLQAALTQLQQKFQGLNSTEKATADRIAADMKRVQNQIDQNTAALNNQKNAWGSLGTTLKNLTAYVGVFAMFNKLKGLFEDFISKNREFSDQLANVRKVSNLAMEDIKELANNLSKIDSRTSLKGLIDLSYTGAKLGFGNYGIEGLESFAKSAVKVQNALSEDMGADSMTALSKMVEVMGLIPKMGVERAMDATGSAIFKLASTSTATGTNIVEFSKRLMGLANIAHISTADLLALGSAADSMALMPEVAATAFNKLITAVQKQPNLIENALNIPKGTISDLYQAGHMTEALVTIFEKMREKGGMNALMQSGVFKDLGSDGARLVGVMATMANRVDMLNAHLAVSRQAFEEGTAVAQEYAIQMDTAAAYSERAANIWEKAFVNPEGVDVVKEFSKAWYDVSKSLTENEKFMFSLKMSLQGILLLLKGIMTILPELMTMVLSGGTWMLITNLRTSEGLLASLTSWFGKLTIAQKAFFKAAGWVGLALTVYEVGKAFYELANETKEANMFMKGFNKTLSDVNKEQMKSVRELDRYRQAIDNANVGTKQRAAAITNFNSKFGPYLKNLLTEKSTALDVAKAYQEVTKQMRAKIALQAKEKDIENQVTPRIQWEAEKLSAYDSSVRGTSRSQYNGTWLKGFVDDARAAGKSIYDIAKELNQQVFHLDQSAFTNVYNQRGKNKVTGRGETTMTDMYGNQRKMNGIITLDEKSTERTFQKALNYALQSYSTSNATEAVNRKYKPFEDDINNIKTQQEEPIEPLVPAPDKDAERALTKAQREEKKHLKLEMDQAEKDSTAVINAIEEFYRLQESAVEQLVADGKMTREEADRALNYVKNRKDTMLMNARRAIAGKDSDFENLRKTMGQDMLRPDDQNSKRAMNTVQTIDVAEAAKRLQKFDGSKAVYDLNAGSFTQAMLKNAAQNELNIQRRQAAVQTEIDKLLLQYQYVEQAQRDFGDKLVKMGLITDGYQKVVQQLADGTEIVANTNEVQGFANKVVGLGSSLYAVNPESTDQLKQLMQSVMTTNGTDKESFAAIFPNYDKWMEQPEQYKEQMQAMYELMIQYEGIYYDKLKQRDDLQNKRLGSWWEHSDQKKENDQKLRNIDLYEYQYDTMKQGETMGFMMGLTNDLTHDPEVMREQAILEAKIAIWQKAKEEREANLISEEVYQQKLRDMQDQTMTYSQKVMDNINKRISRIQNFVKPVETAANTIGKKLGDMIFNMQSEEMTWEQIWKNMALAMAESLLTMVGQYAQYQIQKAAINKAEVLDEAAKAQAITMLGISSGAAKTIGTLGWWGIALIPVITALLMGLLTSALSTVNSSDSGKSTSAATKTKLVSGMLTYDKGNVDRFAGRRKLYDDGSTQVYGRRRYLGEDGKVYTATAEPAPKDGLVTHPIATTVQGQPALVAERGPEIVIGRETTKAIMMNEPQLIKYLADYGKTGGFAGGYRPFDSGNVSEVSAISPQPSDVNGITDADARALVAAITTFNQTVADMQQKGIPCYINKYGRGGLIDEVKSGMKFMSKYEG